MTVYDRWDNSSRFTGSYIGVLRNTPRDNLSLIRFIMSCHVIFRPIWGIPGDRIARICTNVLFSPHEFKYSLQLMLRQETMWKYQQCNVSVCPIIYSLTIAIKLLKLLCFDHSTYISNSCYWTIHSQKISCHNWYISNRSHRIKLCQFYQGLMLQTAVEH